MKKYIVVLVISGDVHHEEAIDVYFDEALAQEHCNRLIATYDETHAAAIIETARHEPRHYHGRAIRYETCTGKTAWLDRQYAA